MSKLGRFVWREIMTQNIEKTIPFFTSLFSWTTSEMDMGGGAKYTMFSAPGAKNAQGGFVALGKEQAGVPSHTLGNVFVDDVDAAAKRVQSHGGKLLMPPADIGENMGRYAVAMDPQGAPIGLYKAPDASFQPSRPKAGEWCWDHLNTTDVKASQRFYGEVFGWKSLDSNGMALFAVGDKMEDMIASVDPVPAGTPTLWLSHIVVDSLEGTKADCTKLGGTILVPKNDVPGMGSFAVLQDPAGVTFAVWQEAAK